jgi:UDP-2,3-diacylglucosamine pyrophosphatase LpxH
MFDGIQSINKYICFLGDMGYDIALMLNIKLNWFQRKFGLRYWSFSKFIKLKVKTAMDFIFKFENNIVDYCKRGDFDGVICGHIHNAQIKEIDSLIYMNCGDWVESCTALVETLDGHWKIIDWKEK